MKDVRDGTNLPNDVPEQLGRVAQQVKGVRLPQIPGKEPLGQLGLKAVHEMSLEPHEEGEEQRLERKQPHQREHGNHDQPFVAWVTENLHPVRQDRIVGRQRLIALAQHRQHRNDQADTQRLEHHAAHHEAQQSDGGAALLCGEDVPELARSGHAQFGSVRLASCHGRPMARQLSSLPVVAIRNVFTPHPASSSGTPTIPLPQPADEGT